MLKGEERVGVLGGSGGEGGHVDSGVDRLIGDDEGDGGCVEFGVDRLIGEDAGDGGEGACVAVVRFEERGVWVRLSWVGFLAFCLCFDVAMADGV